MAEVIETNTYFGRCRCCLEYSYLKNMWSEYIWNGETEVYGEMLVQCFALTWDGAEDLKDHSEQDQICNSCIPQLRIACKFKNKVLESQEKILQELTQEINTPHVFKIEVGTSDESVTNKEDNEESLDTEYLEGADDSGAESVEKVYEVEFVDNEEMKIEYLEDDEDSQAMFSNSNDNENNDGTKRIRKKRDLKKRQLSDTNTDDEGSKTKWPKRLPKHERNKTYKQYTEEDLRNCLEAIRKNELSVGDAAEMYKIPRKTLKSKLRPKDVQNGKTATTADNHKSEQNKTMPSGIKLTVFRKMDNGVKPIVEQKNLLISTKNDTAHIESTKDIDEGQKNSLILSKNNTMDTESTSDNNKNSNEMLTKIKSQNEDETHGSVNETPKIKSEYEGESHESEYITIEIKLECESEPHGSTDETFKIKSEYADETHGSADKNPKIKTGNENETHGFAGKALKKKTKKKSLRKAKTKSEIEYQSESSEDEPLVSPHKDKSLVKGEMTNIQEMNKHKNNIKTVLEYSNATMIKGKRRLGYTCYFCDIQIETAYELKQHNLEVHNDESNRAININIVSNLVLKLDITNLRCKLCQEPIDQLEELMEHLSKTHSKTIYNDIKNYIIPFKFDSEIARCVKCNKDFKHFQVLLEHMSKHYSNYKCSECDRTFINKTGLQKHSYRHKSGEYKCAHCPKVFDCKPKKTNHEITTHYRGGKTRKCAYCDERFSCIDMVLNHEKKVHGIEPIGFPCDMCNKIYSGQNTLFAHKRRCHQSVKRHQCDSCDMAFFSKTELISHTVTHTKTKEHQCSVCNKCFGTTCTLRKHMRIHLNAKQYNCDICKCYFKYKATWKTHMKHNHGIEEQV